MILAARVWDSFDTPIELECTNVTIFLATSMSLTIAQLNKNKK